MEKIQSRNWFITGSVQNLKNAGLSDDQINNHSYVAGYLKDRWNNSGQGRNCCITVCKSKDGFYHYHGALSGEKTTLNGVAKLMFYSHVEECKGGKRILLEYIQKKGKYAEKGETVLAQACDKEMFPKQGDRKDIRFFQKLIDDGFTPEEIFHEYIESIKYEKVILKWFAIKKSKEGPKLQSLYVEWHIGESGTGKTHYYKELCEIHGADNIYIIGDLQNGWIDDYVEKGCPPILFCDDLSEPCDIRELLKIIDTNPNKSIHGRYKNTYPQWSHVYIASMDPPEMVFHSNVRGSNYKKLLGKVDYYVYHYFDGDSIDSYTLPSELYVGYEDLKAKAEKGLKFVKTRRVRIIKNAKRKDNNDDYEE